MDRQQIEFDEMCELVRRAATLISRRFDVWHRQVEAALARATKPPKQQQFVTRAMYEAMALGVTTQRDLALLRVTKLELKLGAAEARIAGLVADLERFRHAIGCAEGADPYRHACNLISDRESDAHREFA